MEHPDGGAGQELPLAQRLFDSPFLLLMAGVAIPYLVYGLWGLVELMRLPRAPLP